MDLYLLIKDKWREYNTNGFDTAKEVVWTKLKALIKKRNKKSSRDELLEQCSAKFDIIVDVSNRYQEKNEERENQNEIRKLGKWP